MFFIGKRFALKCETYFSSATQINQWTFIFYILLFCHCICSKILNYHIPIYIVCFGLKFSKDFFSIRFLFLGIQSYIECLMHGYFNCYRILIMGKYFAIFPYHINEKVKRDHKLNISLPCHHPCSPKMHLKARQPL